jgi:hypothetical protein
MLKIGKNFKSEDTFLFMGIMNYKISDLKLTVQEKRASGFSYLQEQENNPVREKTKYKKNQINFQIFYSVLDFEVVLIFYLDKTKHNIDIFRLSFNKKTTINQFL